jgi:transcriptional regulator
MYPPKYFEETNRETIFSFVEANAFGQLISSVAGRPFSTHIPFILSADKKKLIGHVARQNPQYSDIEGQEVLATFQGAHDYISPSWYSGPGVPTWNYQAVHLYGKCAVFHDTVRLKEVVDTLTHRHESIFSKPWLPEYDSSMLRTIVGIEITISDIEGKNKLSQNKSMQDQTQVIEQLRKLGSNVLADAMRANMNNEHEKRTSLK